MNINIQYSRRRQRIKLTQTSVNLMIRKVNQIMHKQKAKSYTLPDISGSMDAHKEWRENIAS